MPDTKISALNPIVSVQTDDVLPIVDVHDTSQASSGTTKKISLSQIYATAPTLGVSGGGTGLTSLGTSSQVLGVNVAGNALEYKTITAGSNITITPGTGSITIAASASSTGYTTVGQGGTPVTQRSFLNFAGAGVSVADNSGASRTDVTISATVSSVGLSLPATIFSVGGTPVTSTGTLTASLSNQAVNTVWAGPSTGSPAAPAFRALVAADIPSLDASIITTGQLALARGGTGANLSATGGTGQFLKQASTGAAVTVGTISTSDLPTVPITSGGTGQTSATAAFNALSPLTTTGDIIYASAANTASRLAGNTTATKNFLTQTGTGSASQAPAWGTISTSDLPTIPVAGGGTGQTTATAGFNALSPMTTLGDVIYGGASGTGTRLAGNTSATKNFLTQTGNGSVSAAPAWGTLVAGDIPSLPASQITSGQLALARGGTNADLSATGGTGQYLKQASSGAAITVGTISASDVPTTGLTINTNTSVITTDSDGATITFDLGVSNWHTVTLGGNRTLALSNVGTNQQFTIVLIQGAGSNTVTWFSTIKWAGGTPPKLTTAAGGIDVFTFKQVSSGQYYGFVAGQALA